MKLRKNRTYSNIKKKKNLFSNVLKNSVQDPYTKPLQHNRH